MISLSGNYKVDCEIMPMRKNPANMNETELLRNVSEKLDNLILAISVSGKSFQEQVSYLNNLGYKPQKISEIIGRSRQSVKDMVRAVKGRKVNVEKDDVTLRLNALLRLITENSKDKQKYTKAIYYLKSVGISPIEISSIFGVKASSIPSYIRQYKQIKNKEKSGNTEQGEGEQIDQ
jgi:transposase